MGVFTGNKRMMLGGLLKPWSKPFCHNLVRYVFGSAMPKRVRQATVNMNSTTNKPIKTFGNRQRRESTILLRPILFCRLFVIRRASSWCAIARADSETSHSPHQERMEAETRRVGQFLNAARHKKSAACRWPVGDRHGVHVQQPVSVQ